jgi:hypothetical protein
MTHEEAARKIEVILAHAWMVRTFLKHAEEVQDDPELLEVPRTIFDYCRAVEPAAQRGDWAHFIHRARGKLGKLRKASEALSTGYTRVSAHTNFQMASVSLAACVSAISDVLAQAPVGNPPTGNLATEGD